MLTAERLDHAVVIARAPVAGGLNVLEISLDTPVAQAGGPGMPGALAAAFPELNFCPTGGIGADGLRACLALPNVVCVGGAWLTPRDVVDAGDWDSVMRLAREAGR